jgi:hypothetical protein
MTEIDRIIYEIDEFLETRNQKTTTPVEINTYLERKGILKDSPTRPGKPIREILRRGEIPHAYQNGVKWFIPHS